jgi:hypothetical protein
MDVTKTVALRVDEAVVDSPEGWNEVGAGWTRKGRSRQQDGRQDRSLHFDSSIPLEGLPPLTPGRVACSPSEQI